MELAGVYRAARRMNREYPILAIRGLSDVVGFKRDDRWTKYACHSAASFTHVLISSGVIPRNRKMRGPKRSSKTRRSLRSQTERQDLTSAARKLTDRMTSDNGSAANTKFPEKQKGDKQRDLVDSLRKRLEKDFHTAGARIGQFGKERIQGETELYRDSHGEVIKLKPHYYMTYWGWKLMPILLPELSERWTHLTAGALTDRFGGRRWIEVEVTNYADGPALPSVKAETVRHTVKGAEILLLIQRTNLPSQVAWNLINELQSLSNKGGWKEFRSLDSESSLWSSAYVFRFLSKLRQRRCDPAVPGEVDTFIAKSEKGLRQTQGYLESSWNKHRWGLNRLPWEVNAPAMLIECIPFLTNETLVKNAFDCLRELVTPAGVLVNPDIGTPFKAPEYIMSTRLAYALKLCCLLKGYSDLRVDNLMMWVLDNYSEEYTLDTCDIAFLYGLLFSTSDIAW